MFLTKMTIDSECGISNASKIIESKIIVPYIYPLTNERSYIFSIMKVRRDTPLRKEVLSDFENFNIINNGNFTILDGVKRSHHIISPISGLGGIPIFPLIIEDGKEIISFLTFTKDISEQILEKISEDNHISDAVSNKVDMGSVVQEVTSKLLSNVFMGLSTMEKDLMETAYSSGFYSWPRESALEDLAVRFKLSKPTISYHVRSAERKIMRALFGQGT